MIISERADFQNCISILFPQFLHYVHLSCTCFLLIQFLSKWNIASFMQVKVIFPFPIPVLSPQAWLYRQRLQAVNY